jgi:hypothetical protein
MTIFSPFAHGSYETPDRIVIASMARNRPWPGNVPTVLSSTDYARHVSADLIVTVARRAGAASAPVVRSMPRTVRPSVAVGSAANTN